METFNFVVNVINDAVETQQAAAIHEERQLTQEANEAIVNNPNTTTSPDVDHEPQASMVIEVKKAPPLPPRPAFMKDEPIVAPPVQTAPEMSSMEQQPVVPTVEISSDNQLQTPNIASDVLAPPPPPPPPVVTEEVKSPTIKKSILADLPPPPPARGNNVSRLQ